MFAKIAKYFDSEEDEVDWMVREPCPACGSMMFLRDIPQHWVMSHGRDVASYKNEVMDKSDFVTHTQRDNRVRLRDLVDEYDADWLTDETDDSIELQEPSGGHELRSKKLRKRWQPILKELRASGKVKVSKSDHVGKVRGNDIVQHFERDVKRMDLELSIETEYGNAEAVIRKV